MPALFFCLRNGVLYVPGCLNLILLLSTQLLECWITGHQVGNNFYSFLFFPDKFILVQIKSEGIRSQVCKSRGNEIDRQNQEILFEWNDKVILKYRMGEASDYLLNMVGDETPKFCCFWFCFKQWILRPCLTNKFFFLFS